MSEHDSVSIDSKLARRVVQLEDAIKQAIEHAGGRESEWGERAEECFAILERALQHCKPISEHPSQPLAAEQEDAADRAAVAASKAEGVYVPLDQALAEVDQPLAAGDLHLREGGWYRQVNGHVVGPCKPYRGVGIESEYKWTMEQAVYTDDGWTDYEPWRIVEEVPAPSWQPHDGGQCPVDWETMVEVKLRGTNEEIHRYEASDLSWEWMNDGSDIIAWRLAEE